MVSLRTLPTWTHFLATWTPQAFMKNIASKSMNVADVMLKFESQYCVNMAAAMVKVTVLMQFASLDNLAKNV